MNEIMKGLVVDFFSDVINDMNAFGEVLRSPYLLSLEPENQVGDLYNFLMLIHNILIGFGISLLIVVFLKKGFSTYILWTDGDPDTDPGSMLIRFIQAIAFAICFPAIYPYIVKVAISVITKLNNAIGVPEWQDYLALVMPSFGSGVGWLRNLLAFVYLICYIIILFKFFMLGVELFILRGGFALACIGLLDADKSVFVEYIKMFTKAILTIIVQYISLTISIKIGVGYYSYFNILFGIAFLFVGMGAPKLIDRFLLPGSGGGMVGKASSAMHFVSSVRMITMKR